MFFIYIHNSGRVGNCIFRFLMTRIISLLYNATIIDTKLEGTLCFDDDEFKKWRDYIINNKLLPEIKNNISIYGFYQDDILYRMFKQQLIGYILKNPNETITTDDNFSFKSNDILGVNPFPNIHNYRTIIHLRIEDFLAANIGMDPTSIENVLKKCEEPFLFVHKPVANNLDINYINYFKKKYPKSLFYCEDVLKCYNLMRHAKILVCSKSTLSWAASLLSDTLEKVYVPKNYETVRHELFQTPINNTEIYDWAYIKHEDILNLK